MVQQFQARRRAALWRTLPNLAFGSYVLALRSLLAGCRSVLDVGCGDRSPIRFVDLDVSVGVDGFAPGLRLASGRRTHSAFVQSDVRAVGNLFRSKSFDACVALDLVEHLEQSDGINLIHALESISRRCVILFTPNGFIPQSDTANDLQLHKSGWTVGTLRDLGYSVSGVYGSKSLRGEHHDLRYRPKLASGVLSLLTHVLWTSKHPQRSAALLAVKSV